MNNLLFTALLLALLYYFCYYLPQQKKLNANPPFKHQQATQTEPKDDSELAKLKTQNQTLQAELKTNQQDYQAKIKTQATQITNLQTQVRDLAKRPCQPTNHKSIQTASETELTNTLDTLIKDIQDLNKSLK